MQLTIFLIYISNAFKIQIIFSLFFYYYYYYYYSLSFSIFLVLWFIHTHPSPTSSWRSSHRACPKSPKKKGSLPSNFKPLWLVYILFNNSCEKIKTAEESISHVYIFLFVFFLIFPSQRLFLNAWALEYSQKESSTPRMFKIAVWTVRIDWCKSTIQPRQIWSNYLLWFCILLGSIWSPL
jgi:hypothetical protein